MIVLILLLVSVQIVWVIFLLKDFESIEMDSLSLL